MIKSMTAYGKSQIENEAGRITVEIQSINRKYLDLNINLPKELYGFDPEIREWLKPYIARGQVQLRVTFNNLGTLTSKISLNLPLVEEYKKAIEQLSDKLKIESPPESVLELIMQQPQIFSHEVQSEDENLKQLMKIALEKALSQFQKMKADEGQALARDLSSRLKLIEACLEQILPLAQTSPSKYQEKLLKRLQEISNNTEIVDQRILIEVALFADKMDVSEEITRFQSHLAQFYQFLKSEEPVGKTLEFLLQEMFREINTMNAKIGELKGVQLCLEIKGELEKMREQIQNIE